MYHVLDVCTYLYYDSTQYIKKTSRILDIIDIIGHVDIGQVVYSVCKDIM